MHLKWAWALGTILLLATQRPDKDSLPTGISANVGIRFCLRVMGQTENDMEVYAKPHLLTNHGLVRDHSSESWRHAE